MQFELVKFHRLIIFNFTQTKVEVSGLELIAIFSQSGLHGEVHFSDAHNYTKVKIKSFFETTIQYPEQSWTWGVFENPIDYSVVDPEERCSKERVGSQLINLDDHLGFLILPGNESSTWNNIKVNLTGEFIDFVIVY